MNKSDDDHNPARRAVVTGTGGLGYETALALSDMGWRVIVAGRDPHKGASAVKRIKALVPQAAVMFEQVDLADLASIAAFGRRMNSAYESVDVLVNNAGVMTPPRRRVTVDGFELQFGVNYLGHFALTSHLLPLLRKATASRVVSVSSIASRGVAINFGDLQSEQVYKAFEAYGQSKLAQLIFALELQRRSQAGGWGVTSIAAHPGLARTDLIPNGAGKASASFLLRQLLWFVFQSPAQGALPSLFAATSPTANPGAYYGPDKWSELRGNPALARIPKKALDQKAASHLWDLSEQLAGVSFGETQAKHLRLGASN
jgi:NAD(P)-dependent dehydrogenase (short-subunit alcohol dehydrogenase family)